MSRSEKNKTPYKEQWQSRRTATVLGIMAQRPQHREQWHCGHRLDTKIANRISSTKDKTIQHHTITPFKHQTHYGKEHKRINPNPIRRCNALRRVRTRSRRFHRTAHRTNPRIRVRNIRRMSNLRRINLRSHNLHTDKVHRTPILPRQQTQRGETEKAKGLTMRSY